MLRDGIQSHLYTTYERWPYKCLSISSDKFDQEDALRLSEKKDSSDKFDQEDALRLSSNGLHFMEEKDSSDKFDQEDALRLSEKYLSNTLTVVDGGNQNGQTHIKDTSVEDAEYDLTLAEFEIHRKCLKTQRRKESKWKKNLKYSSRQRISQIKKNQETKGFEGERETIEDINQNTKSPRSWTEEEEKEKREEAILTYQQARRLGLEGLAPDEEMIQQLMNLG